MTFDVTSFMGGTFLTQLDLPQPYQVLQLSKVDKQQVGQGSNAEDKVCVTFAGDPKALALNKTNLKRIAKLYSPDANSWIGKSLLVYRSTTTFSGETTLCVRVCGPQQAPPDPICDANGNAVVYQPQAQLSPWESPDANNPPSV